MGGLERPKLYPTKRCGRFAFGSMTHQNANSIRCGGAAVSPQVSELGGRCEPVVRRPSAHDRQIDPILPYARQAQRTIARKRQKAG